MAVWQNGPHTHDKITYLAVPYCKGGNKLPSWGFLEWTPHKQFSYVFSFLSSRYRSTKPKSASLQAWLISLLITHAQTFCNGSRQRPQSQTAKPNWRRSDSTAGGSGWDLSTIKPWQTRRSRALCQTLGGREHRCKHCGRVMLDFSQGSWMALLHLLHGSKTAIQNEEQNILQFTNCVCLVCLLNFTFPAYCTLSRAIAAAYVSKEQETDCQRPSQGISKINKHNMHIRWSECQRWDKLNLQRKCRRNFPLNHTKL